MMPDSSLTLNKDPRGVVTLSINRPEIHNAFDDVLIAELIEALDSVENDPEARVLILRSEGKSFSAGADLRWMRRMADYTEAENKADAMELAALMKKLNKLNIPTIARVQGAAFGGGVGLVACCDIAVGSTKALFCLSEVRLGLMPAVISPYVLTAMGERAARRYFLTAERFDAEQALRINLLHETVEEDDLDATIEEITKNLLKGGGCALTAAKDLIFAVSSRLTTDELIEDTAERITKARASDEGKEGLNSFLEKRSPSWIKN